MKKKIFLNKEKLFEMSFYEQYSIFICQCISFCSYLSIYLSIYLILFLSIYLSIYLILFLSIYLSIDLSQSIHIHISIYQGKFPQHSGLRSGI